MSEATDMSAIGTAVTTVGVAVAKKTFSQLFAKLMTGAIETATKRAIKSFVHARPNFEPHFTATFGRCTKIKTLLNRDEPIELLSQYVNQRFFARENNMTTTC
jgi:hypothetical protein